MLMTKERLPAIRTLRGWAISVLQDAGAIRECEDHFALSARVHPSDIANDPESLYVLALIGGFDVERLYQSSLELLSSLRAAAVGGVGRCSEGSAKELRVVQETEIEATYFPPHS